MNYNETADKILHAWRCGEYPHAHHCATRLRMEFNDRARLTMRRLAPSRRDQRGGEGQFQIVIGNEVQQVYRRLIRPCRRKSPTGGDKNAKPTGIVARVISVISTTLTR
jgi:PTS system beta-glucosides-specific IIC component